MAFKTSKLKSIVFEYSSKVTKFTIRQTSPEKKWFWWNFYIATCIISMWGNQEHKLINANLNPTLMELQVFILQRLESARTADIFLAMYICNYLLVYFKYNLALLRKKCTFCEFSFCLALRSFADIWLKVFLFGVVRISYIFGTFFLFNLALSF